MSKRKTQFEIHKAYGDLEIKIELTSHNSLAGIPYEIAREACKRNAITILREVTAIPGVSKGE